MEAKDTKKYGKELSIIGCKLNDLGARCAMRYENDEQTLEDICRVGEDVFEIAFPAGEKQGNEKGYKAGIDKGWDDAKKYDHRYKT